MTSRGSFAVALPLGRNDSAGKHIHAPLHLMRSIQDMKIKRKVVATTAAGVTAAALSIGALSGFVSAQTTPTPTPRATGTPQAGQNAQNAQNRQNRAQEFLKALATNLGISEDRLTSAVKQTATQQIDAEVAAGRIPADRAQQIKDGINQGNLPGFGFGGPGGHGGRGGPGGIGGMMGSQELATFLGVTQDQLRQEMPGKSLAQVAQAHGKSADQLKQFLTTQVTTRMNEAVQSGRITQDQANQRLTEFRNNLDTMINRVMPQMGQGRMR